MVATLFIASLLPALDAAFVFSGPNARCPRPAVASLVSSPVMVSAKEVYGQLYEASPPVQKSMSSLPPPVAKGAMAGLVAVTGAAGFLLTPSRRIAVNAVGGAITAGVGNIARKRLSDERQKAAVPAVAALLSQGLQSVTPESLSEVAAEYSVPAKEFRSQLGELYLSFLSATLTTHVVETSELSELLRLQALLKLSFQQVGTQVYSGARQLYSRHRAYLEDTEPNDSKLLLEKFVFLAERILSKDDSPEGYRYETLRLQKLFNLTPPEWSAMSEKTAVPFYEKALNSAVVEGKAVTAEQLGAVRDSLGITDGCAAGMHEEVFGKSAAAMLATGSFVAADKDRLTATQALLGMDEAITSRTLLALTSPLYTTTFTEALTSLESDANNAGVIGKLAAAQQELLLDSADAANIESAALRAKAQTYLTDAIKLLKAQNVPQGLEAVQTLVSFCERMAAFMVETQHAAGPAEAAIGSLFADLRGDHKKSEVLSMYRVLLLHYLEDMKVDEQEASSLERLRGLLGLSEAETTSVYQAAAGPLYRNAVMKAIDGSAGAAQKAELDATLADLSLPAEVTKVIGAEVYSARLQAFSADGAILGEEQAAELETLRGFLGIEMADVYDVHEKCGSETYRKSVKEVMGSTSGAIPDEYFEGLTQLRARLGLSEEAAQAIFKAEVTAKLRVFGEKAIAVLEAKAKAQQSGESESGELGMASLSTAVLDMVDFAIAAKALVTTKVGEQEVDVATADLRSEFESNSIKELYKQYLVEAFSGGDAATNQRLFSNLYKLSLVLGLKENEVSIIHNQIGGVIYRQYISKALKDKGSLGQEERGFLEQIKGTLAMDDQKAENLVRDCEVNHVAVLVEQMFEKSSVVVEDVRAMRDAADLLDVDLKRDLQVSDFKCERFFMCELEDLVESDQLSQDDLGPLEELFEPFHISEDSATTMLEETIQKRASAGLLQAASSLRMQETDAAVSTLGRMLKYTALMECTADAPAVSESERSELYMLFQASMLARGEGAAGADKLEMLKSVIGLAVTA